MLARRRDRRHRADRQPLTKLALRDGGHADLEAAVQWEALAQPVTLATEDLQEGIAAGAGEAGAAASPGADAGRKAGDEQRRGPLPPPCAACLPLATPPDSAEGLVWGQT